VLVMFSDGDIAIKQRKGSASLAWSLTGAYTWCANAGHYLQEDLAEAIADRMVTFLRDNAKVTIA